EGSVDVLQVRRRRHRGKLRLQRFRESLQRDLSLALAQSAEQRKDSHACLRDAGHNGQLRLLSAGLSEPLCFIWVKQRGDGMHKDLACELIDLPRLANTV